MINDGPLDLIAAKLKPGGEFRIATDDPTYLNWSLMVMQRHADQFEWLVKEPASGSRYPSRLARDPLRRQGPARGPHAAPVPLPARLADALPLDGCRVPS